MKKVFSLIKQSVKFVLSNFSYILAMLGGAFIEMKNPGFFQGIADFITTINLQELFLSAKGLAMDAYDAGVSAYDWVMSQFATGEAAAQ